MVVETWNLRRDLSRISRGDVDPRLGLDETRVFKTSDSRGFFVYIFSISR